MKLDSLNIFAELVGDEDTRDKICESIYENSKLDVRFVFMNTLAGIVASYGLLADSTATVIGAMVMATLLGAISGIALALVQRDSPRLRESVIAAAAGVVIVLCISFVVGWFHRWLPLSSEILARTHPNILDLVIGIAGGAAGAYAMVSPRVSAGLVGVAIATALVPPIAVCGLCLARGEFGLSLGAFELFLTNFAAIQFITSVMMWLFGFQPSEKLSAVKMLQRNRISLLVLISLGVVLSLNLYHSVRRHQLETGIRKHITQYVEELENAELIRLNFDYRDRTTVRVTAVVVTPKKLARDVVAVMEAGMPKSPDYDVEADMLYLLSDRFENPASTGNSATSADAPASAQLDSLGDSSAADFATATPQPNASSRYSRVPDEQPTN